MADPKKKGITKASQQELRRLYAQHIEKHVRSRRYFLREVSRNPPRVKDLPTGTSSVIYDIHNERAEKIGVVHAYILPDGSVGASGKYDPKMLIISGVRYHVDLTLPGAESSVNEKQT